MRKITLIFLIALLFVPGIAVYGNQEFGSYTGVIRNDKLFISLRGVFTDLGFQVSWNDNAKSITLINPSNTLIITTRKVNLNGTEKPLTVSPIFHTENLREPLENRLNPLIYKEHEEFNFSPKR